MKGARPYTQRLRDDAVSLIRSEFERRYFVPGQLVPGLRVRGHRQRAIAQPVLEAVCNALVAQGVLVYDTRHGYRLVRNSTNGGARERASKNHYTRSVR